jgi:alpha-L-rhamnosidase
MAVATVPVVALSIGGRSTHAAPPAPPPPPLKSFATLVADDVGARLQASFVWADPTVDRPGVAVAFRRSFDLTAIPGTAVLSLFADARYVLWLNGAYVDRGPSRFQPNGPQYDVVDLSHRLRLGRNVLSVLVVGNLSGGKVMHHRPGLAAQIDVDGRPIVTTDRSWKWTDQTRYQQVKASWANITDGVVDARAEDGDWAAEDYDDARWKPAVPTDGAAWGPLTRTLIPPLRESPVPYTLGGSRALPVTLNAGDKLEFDTGRIVQAYPAAEFEADAGTELAIDPWGAHYLARAGRQSYFTLDSRGLSHGTITVKSGRVTITALRLVERLYPYDRLGSFTSNDEQLDKLWKMCARSCEVLSEDSYVDCADRERVEWMDDTPPGYDVTRTAMAGPGPNGTTVFSDPRLLGQLVRRTALTLQPDGWVKAHTCSDRYDIHAKMEDRACDWVTGERLYYEATGDATILRQTWPAAVAQMDYFLARRTVRGLVRCRDWVVWGNPTGYLVGETTTLNAFVYGALVDAAALATVVGDAPAAARYGRAAEDLSRAVNDVLWDDRNGAYFAGRFEDADVAENATNKRRPSLSLVDHLAASTLHANVFALERGIVPPDRRTRVTAAFLGQRHDDAGDAIMIDYYIAGQLYGLDRPDLDRQVLDLFRRRWAGMVAAPWQCSWEGFAGGSKAHIYGMYPGYFLSAYVLGVRRDRPVAAKAIVIEPHLGDLTRAAGTVVTEFGPVPVSWARTGESLDFTCEVPPGVRATLLLPRETARDSITLDGKAVRSTPGTKRFAVDLGPGAHAGRS